MGPLVFVGVTSAAAGSVAVAALLSELAAAELVSVELVSVEASEEAVEVVLASELSEELVLSVVSLESSVLSLESSVLSLESSVLSLESPVLSLGSLESPEVVLSSLLPTEESPPPEHPQVETSADIPYGQVPSMGMIRRQLRPYE